MNQRTYLQDIVNRIDQIERFTHEGEAAFLADDRTQEAVIRCFEVIGEAIKRLDSELLTQYPSIPWRDFTGFRDVLIHQYDKILLPKVWQAVQEDLAPLRIVVEQMLAELPNDGDQR